jgi:two-component system NarL family sensor kinase
MRSLIWQLRPRGLEHGIVSSLTEYGKMLGLSIHTKVNGVIHLPQQVEEALWRIGQEALANCKKHAQTDEAYLEVKVNSRWIVMKIFDEGSGFSYKESLELPSLGLKSMRLRTEQIGGTFKLQTSQGQGTTIEITIPLQRRN